MPRETVFTPYPLDPANGPLPFQIKVGWEREQDVQLGIATHDDRHLVDYIYASEEAVIGCAMWEHLREHDLAQPADFENTTAEGEFYTGLGRAVLDSVTGSTPFGTSVWATPGRAQINDLIKLLRKARDAAFGRDE